MIYMNAGESSGSPTASIDVGWAANVNDQGSYYHVGLFRDATDQTFKVFHEYTPEPDASVEINTGHASFALAPFAASTLTGVYQGFDSDVTAAGLATQIYVTSTIDSSYVQARQTPQDFAYSSLTGAPTSVSTFTNDANYISTGDSASLSELIVTGNLTGNSLRADNLTTQNAFVIVGDSNNLIQDTTLSVDPASNYLGINQTSPEVTLHMTGEGAQTAQIRMEQYNNSADAPDLRTRRYRGTIASPSSIQPGDYLYRSNHEYWNGSALIVGGTFAFDNTNDSNRTQFAISVTTDGTSADANTPSKIQFKIDGNDGGAITFNNAYKFPTSDGTNDQVLATDGGGNLSFVSVASISGGVDSGDVKSIVDSAYINARVVIPTAFDSADVVGIVDSAYVQARQTPQDFAYSSLTGAPTNVSSFTNDAGYTTYDSTNAAGQIEAYGYTTYDSTNAAGQIEAYGYTTFDSTNAVGLITGYGYSTYDSTNASGQIEAYGYTTYDSSNTTGMLSSYASQSYVTGAIDDRVDQTFVENLGISYTSLTNKPTNLYDSTNFNSQLTPAIGASIQAYDSNLTDFVNAFTLPVSDGSSNNVLSTNGSGTLSFVSVASISGSVDSGDVRSIVDSAYVQARQIPPNNVDLTNYHYVATAGQTSFSGSDIAGNSLTYTTSNIQVFKNGVLLIDSDDYTATNGSTIVLSSSARSGDTISISNYGQSAGSLNLRDSGSGITVTASLSVEGAMYVNGSVETLIDKSSATGTVTHDFSEGALFYHSSISSNFTVNLTNFPTTNGKAIVVSLILDQGATAYIPNALQVGGVAQTINWFGGSAPSGNANKKDLVAFTLIRRSSSWTVLGQLSSYG
jgi:hypothetical protein